MQEKNRDILKCAIVQLPEFHVKGIKLWQGIEMKLDSTQNTLPELPQFKAPENTWNKVEERLNEHASPISKAIADLPEYRAPVDTWKEIENNLDKRSDSYNSNRIFFIVKIAASILILISVSYGIIRYRVQSNQISEGNTFPATEQSTGIESIYNPALCQSNPQVCNTELFKSLDKELHELKQELEELKSLMKEDDPQLKKYYHRLVNERIDVEKRMVKIIMES
jgi:hypothetical protein